LTRRIAASTIAIIFELQLLEGSMKNLVYHLGNPHPSNIIFNLLAIFPILFSGLLPYGSASNTAVIRPRMLNPARQFPTSTEASATIYLTDTGFSPEDVNIVVGEKVTWINQTTKTHRLKSGLPSGGYSIFLPMLQTAKTTGFKAENQPSLDPLNDGVSFSLVMQEYFSATLAPGSQFEHTFTTSGETPFYSATQPSFKGKVTVLDAPIPPDPAIVAPPPDPGVATDIFSSTEFLYSGSNPIQTGVAADTILAEQVAVLRGKVTQGNGSPLAGVRVSVKDHPEFGQTFSRTDGLFDLALNGGEFYTIDYTRSGYLPVQRKLEPNWRDFVQAPDVVLLPLDTRVTAINLTAGGMQVAQGNTISDTDGTRAGTLLIPAGTQAELVFANGDKRSISSFHVRVTEYTQGTQGPQAMPGELPPESGYTYAVEYSLDEAIQAGAVNVNFNQPILHYSQNFLHFDVGSAVPTGYYDRIKAQWVPGDNGRVVKILSIANGQAALDTDGDGVADNGTTMKPAISTAELQRLAQVYLKGQELWRVPVQHFTPWDCNWPYGPPEDAKQPNLPKDKDPISPKDKDECGSIIGCEDQTLGERVPLVGTDFSLVYNSRRTPLDAYKLTIPLTEASYPASMARIDVIVTVANRYFTQSFTPGSNLSYDFTWDGKDAYGRSLIGEQHASVRLGYVYPAVYYKPMDFARSFGQNGGSISANKARMEMTLWQTVYDGTIGAFDARLQGLGGWTLSENHLYNPTSHILYQGDGHQRSAETQEPAVIYTYYSEADQAISPLFDDLTMSADGSLYIADAAKNHVIKVAPDKSVTLIAGNGVNGYSGDGGLAVNAELRNPSDVALGPDGSLFITDSNNHIVRKVSPSGVISTVAGTYAEQNCARQDGVPATSYCIFELGAVTVAPDGTLFIGSAGHIFKVMPDGNLYVLAGGGVSQADHIPARQSSVNYIYDLALGPDGTLYLTDRYRIRKITTDGLIDTVAGNGTWGFSGDGGPAVQAELGEPMALALAPDGSLYISDSDNNRVRRVRPDGILETVAGGDFSTDRCPGSDPCPEGSPARMYVLALPRGIAIGPDNLLYVADHFHYSIRVVKPGLPGYSQGDTLIASSNGWQVYHFNAGGKHLQTLDALTGGLIYQFSYDSQGRLAWIKDGSGNQTTVERDTSGIPTAIVGPYGARTLLTLNPSGRLDAVVNPAGETVTLTYNTDGLLQIFQDGRSGQHVFSYDTKGRLTGEQDPAGNLTSLTRVEASDGYTVTLASTPNFTHVYGVHRLPGGDILSVFVDMGNTRKQILYRLNGTEVITNSSGVSESFTYAPDPIWGMGMPYPSAYTRRTPGLSDYSFTRLQAASLTAPGNPFSVEGITTTQTTGDGRATTWTYTGADRTLVMKSPAGRTETTRYDSLGRVASRQTGGMAAVESTYDSHGRLAALTQTDGSETRSDALAYNSDGELASYTDALSHVYHFAYDLAGRIATFTEPGGAETAFTYDANGNLLSVIPPGKSAHIYTYNPQDLMDSYTPPGNGSQSSTFEYNDDKTPQRFTYAGGGTEQFGYSSSGVTNRITLSRGAIKISYNPQTGQVAGITDPGGVSLSLAYTGDLLTRTSWSGPVTGSVEYAYDNALRLASDNAYHLTPSDGATIAYQYDDDDLLYQAGDDLYVYRSNENPLISSLRLGSIQEQLTYNGFAEMTGISQSYSWNPLYEATFERNKLGRITTLNETVDGVTSVYAYIFDARGRLTTVKKDGTPFASYTYAANGNRTSGSDSSGTRTGTYDDQDRLTAYGTNIYTYTPNGELNSKVSASGTVTYTYDALGSLLASKLADGRIVAYQVDGSGRRIAKRINGNLVKGFLYNGQRIIAELDASGSVVSRFVYASRDNTPDTMIKGGVVYGILSDQLGSPRLVVDSSTGVIAQRIDYDAFGRVLADSAPGFQPFGFAGGLYDPDTGLVRFGHRDYDAETGRWTAKDPTRFASSPGNLYAYAGNDPVNERDLSGTYSFWTPNPDGTRTYHTDSTDIPQDVQDAVDRGEADVQVTPPDTRSTWQKFSDWLDSLETPAEPNTILGFCQGRRAAEDGTNAAVEESIKEREKAAQEQMQQFKDWLNRWTGL
jgi:RHS repeat-associated protein